MRIQRPTVIVGGELTLKHLEMKVDPITGIVEAPLHLKSNCGVFVLDDFGRQQVSVSELLNRWIIPLEKHLDHQTLPTDDKFKCRSNKCWCSPQISSSLYCGRRLLRRIPFKVEIQNPQETEFHQLFNTTLERLSIPCEPGAIEYLIETHYRLPQRSMRFCHVRDLVEQVRCLCEFFEHRWPSQKFHSMWR